MERYKKVMALGRGIASRESSEEKTNCPKGHVRVNGETG